MGKIRADDKIELSKEQYKLCIAELQDWFRKEREEEIGGLQAQILLDFLLLKLGPFIYNQTISDMHKFMQEKVEESFGLLK